MITSKRLLFVVLAAATIQLIVGCGADSDGRSVKDPDSLLKLLHSAPRLVDGHRYRCAEMVYLVNQLRNSGKKMALMALEQYAKESRLNLDNTTMILLICRCLFKNPIGWDPPGLGMPGPNLALPAINSYPEFPIAFSHGIPFFVIEGYQLEGLPEFPEDCVAQCGSLDIIPSDLPTTGFAAAARAIVEEPRFKALYPDRAVQKQILEMLLKQAEEK